MSDRPAIDLFDFSPDPAVLLAADGARLKANAAFRRAFPHAASTSRPPWGRINPPDFVGGERSFEAAAPDGRRYEWREQKLPDGTRLATARDVTERVEAAETAARAKTLLFATLTHELRTPLNGILGMYEVLAQTQRAPAEREYLQTIRQSGEHLLNLITDILDYARLDAGSFQLEEHVFDPEEVLQSVAELMSPKAYEKGLDICVRVEAGAPARLIGDVGRLKQILFNLVGNALKFTPEGGVALEARPAGSRIRFTVRDTGPGVPSEMKVQVFEEFVQADSSHARRFGGAGLGLAIVRKIAAMMGGEAGLDQAPGAGAAFWVDLPLMVAVPADAPEQELAGLSVLIVAPTPLLGQTIAYTLATHGAIATTAESMEMFDAAEKPDVILLDHKMAQGVIAPFAVKGAPIVIIAPQEERAVLARYREAGGETLTYGAYAEAWRRFGDTLLTGGLRADGWTAAAGFRTERDATTGALTLDLQPADHSDNAFTGRLALRRDFGETYFRSAVYRGFRPPTLNELHRPFRVGNDVTEANTALAPETLW